MLQSKTNTILAKNNILITEELAYSAKLLLKRAKKNSGIAKNHRL
jgi:hypothetical protein